jgi:hypothetical protein
MLLLSTNIQKHSKDKFKLSGLVFGEKQLYKIFRKRFASLDFWFFSLRKRTRKTNPTQLHEINQEN